MGSQKKSIDTVAYWKSQAISLQYENKLLHDHIEMLYKAIYINDDCEPVPDEETTEWVLSDEMKQFMAENSKNKESNSSELLITFYLQLTRMIFNHCNILGVIWGLLVS